MVSSLPQVCRIFVRLLLKIFDGPGDAWSPENLLLAAVQSCFLFTFQAVA
jgi:uncharacterized OsmC-like protein